MTWVFLPLAVGFFLMWRIAEYELKQYKKAYGESESKLTKLRKKLEKEQRKSIPKRS
jgi:hypothetical protein